MACDIKCTRTELPVILSRIKHNIKMLELDKGSNVVRIFGKSGFFREFELYFANILDMDLKLFFGGDPTIRRFGKQKSLIFGHFSQN